VDCRENRKNANFYAANSRFKFTICSDRRTASGADFVIGEGFSLRPNFALSTTTSNDHPGPRTMSVLVSIGSHKSLACVCRTRRCSTSLLSRNRIFSSCLTLFISHTGAVFSPEVPRVFVICVLANAVKILKSVDCIRECCTCGEIQSNIEPCITTIYKILRIK
jgi:hypothetical protein